MSTTISISVMCSVGSLTCGILSLVLPFIALARRKTRCHLQRSVWVCAHWRCSDRFSSTMSAYMHRISSALLDTSFAIRFCAVVLFLLAAVVNAGVCMYQMKRSVKATPATLIYHN